MSTFPMRRCGRPMQFWRATPVILAMGMGLIACPAAAKEAVYDVTHTMVIKPNQGFGGQWQAGWRYVVGQVKASYDGVTSRPKNLKGQIEPFTGPGSPKELDAVVGPASAHGSSGATVAFGGGDAPFTGTINVNGFAKIPTPTVKPASAFAASSSYLIAGLKRTSSSGAITWNSITSISARGCTHPCTNARDPLGFQLIDPNTGGLLSGTFLDIDLSITQGDGDMTWQGGVLSVNSGLNLSGSFLIDRRSPFSTTHGSVFLRFVDNFIVESTATGIYAGLAPSVGASALGSFHFGEPDVDYDFGYGNVPLAVDFLGGNSGVAFVADVPEPAAWALLIVGFGLTGMALRRRRQLAAA